MFVIGTYHSYFEICDCSRDSKKKNRLKDGVTLRLFSSFLICPGPQRSKFILRVRESKIFQLLKREN